MGASTVNGIPYPEASDANNVPSDMAAMAAALDAGSIVKRLTQTQINALTEAQRPAGLVVFNQTTGGLQMSLGTLWVALPRVLAGVVTIASNGAVVTFPAGTFASAPTVIASLAEGSQSNTQPAAVQVGAVTSAQAALYAHQAGAMAVGSRVAWVAVGL